MRCSTQGSTGAMPAPDATTTMRSHMRVVYIKPAEREASLLARVGQRKPRDQTNACIKQPKQAVHVPDAMGRKGGAQAVPGRLPAPQRTWRTDQPHVYLRGVRLRQLRRLCHAGPGPVPSRCDDHGMAAGLRQRAARGAWPAHGGKAVPLPRPVGGDAPGRAGRRVP